MSPHEQRLVPTLWSKSTSRCCSEQSDADNTDVVPSQWMLPATTTSDDDVSSDDDEEAQGQDAARTTTMHVQQQRMILSTLLNDPSFRIATMFLPPLPMMSSSTTTCTSSSPNRRPSCLRQRTVATPFTLLFRQCFLGNNNRRDTKSVYFCNQVNIATYTEGSWTTTTVCCMNISETSLLLVDTDDNDHLHGCKSSSNRSTSIFRRCHSMRDSSCTDPRIIRLA